jgi:TIR domain
MAGESPKPASTPTGAVFLSYASQDAEAAKRICDALRAAGIEVWFDQSELRGGDAWDRKIRDQIHDCRLFIPVISANTERRDEGYFRREWALAADRTRDMAHKRAFLVPVAIDTTPERAAAVPEKFLELQWTRLAGGETLSGEASTMTQPAMRSDAVPLTRQPSTMWRSNRALPLIVAMGMLAAIAYLAIDKPWISKPAAAPSLTPPASIAVLPLANESGEASQQYFSDGISEDLITALSQFPGLKVIGRTSAFQFRDSKEDSRTIGAKLRLCMQARHAEFAV